MIMLLHGKANYCLPQSRICGSASFRRFVPLIRHSKVSSHRYQHCKASTDDSDKSQNSDEGDGKVFGDWKAFRASLISAEQGEPRC